MLSVRVLLGFVLSLVTATTVTAMAITFPLWLLPPVAVVMFFASLHGLVGAAVLLGPAFFIACLVSPFRASLMVAGGIAGLVFGISVLIVSQAPTYPLPVFLYGSDLKFVFRLLGQHPALFLTMQLGIGVVVAGLCAGWVFGRIAAPAAPLLGTSDRQTYALLAVLFLSVPAIFLAWQLAHGPVSAANAAPAKFIVPGEFDTAPIKVRMGGQRFEIPANAFDGPHAVLSYDGPYAVMDGILLKGLAPNFELRSPTNGAVFRKYDCCIRVLISKVTILTPQQVVPKLVNSWLSEVNVLSKNVENGETHYVFSAPHHIPVFSAEGDIYVAANEQEATLCGRVDAAAGIVGPVCKVYSGGAAGSYEVSMPKAERDVRRAELSKVREKLHSWMR